MCLRLKLAVETPDRIILKEIESPGTSALVETHLKNHHPISMGKPGTSPRVGAHLKLRIPDRRIMERPETSSRTEALSMNEKYNITFERNWSRSKRAGQANSGNMCSLLFVLTNLFLPFFLIVYLIYFIFVGDGKTKAIVAKICYFHMHW